MGIYSVACWSTKAVGLISLKRVKIDEKLLWRKKRERGRIQGLPKFLGSLPLIISGTGKATNFKFCTHIGSMGTKPINNFGKSSGHLYYDSSISFVVCVNVR